MTDIKLMELVSSYRASRGFQALAPSTKRNTEKSLSKVAQYMHRPISRLSRSTLCALMDDMPAGAAYVFATRMRALFGFAVSRDILDANPMDGVPLPKSGEYRPWDASEVAAFLDPSVEEQTRMGVMLAFYTGQRMSDVVRMQWSDIFMKDGKSAIHVRQQKTGVELFLPVHERLQRALDKHPRVGKTILSQWHGTAYTPETFRKKFNRERSRLALPDDLCFHGLRKTIAVALAGNGATTQEIMAVGGWKTSRQVDHYCKGVDQFAMAKAAFARLV